MTTSALQGSRIVGVRPLVRWLLFVICAAVFFVLAYSSATTWGEVQEGLQGGFAGQLDSMEQGNESGNRNRQAAGIALGLLGTSALVSKRGAARLRPMGALGWLLTAYIALYFLSIGWADEPQLTMRRVAAFGMMALAVGGLVRLLPAEDMVSFALFAATVYLLIALAAECFTGSLHPFAPDYRFSGVFHPNTVGSLCAILLSAAASTDWQRPRRWRIGAAASMGVVVLLLTRSRASLLGLLAALAVRWMVAARRSRKCIALAVGAWILCAACVAAGDAIGPAIETAVSMARADSDVGTLGGRTDLWEELLRYIGQRPVLGYGLGGFWGARHVREIYLSQRWPVAEAHSTYVEQLLDVGAIGLGLYVAVMAGALWRAALRLKASHDGVHGFMLCVLVYFLVAGFFETMQPNPSLPTFLLFWTLGHLAFRATPAPVAPRSPCVST